VLRWPDPRLWILCLIASLGVFFAFGDQTPVFTSARKVLPLLGVARYPVKFVFALSFIVPLLAGCGAAAVVRGKLTRTALAAGALVVAAVVFIAWAGREERYVDYSAWPEDVYGNMHYSWNTASRGRMLPDAVANTLQRVALHVGALVLFAGALRSGKYAPAWALGCLALIAVDVRTHAPQQNPSLPAAELRGTRWPEDHPKPEAGSGRVLITPQAEAFLTFVSSTNASRVWQLKRRAEWSSLNMLDGIAKVNGSSTLQTRRQRLVEQTLYGMTNRLPAPLLDFLAVAYTTDTNAVGEWSARASSLPLITAGQRVVFEEDEQTLRAITNATFDPKATVFLPPEARAWIMQTNAVTATLSDVRVTTGEALANVNAPEPTIMVIAQSFYPAWKASIDGASVPLVRANLAFQAVTVPAGEHRVRVIYDRASIHMGGIISAVSLLVCAGVWWRAGKQRGP
jgi:hypothetical protein